MPDDAPSGVDAAEAAATSFLDGRRPIVVSNRQPYSHEYDGDEVVVNRPAGGLTAALDPVMQTLEGTWVAWGSGDADRVVADDDVVRVPPENPAYDLRRVWLDEDQVDGYYYGYSNRALWPLSHSDTVRASFDHREWETYREVNDLFADAVLEGCRAQLDGDAAAGTNRPVVWFHDYHLTLAPRRVRAQLDADPFLLHFWHLPWPGLDVFRSCPHAETLLDGLLANDLLGFHADAYCRRFLDCVAGVLDADVDRTTGAVRYGGDRTYVRPFGIGIDADRQRRTAEDDAAAEYWTAFRRTHDIDDDQYVGVGVDRLDYTKGIVERLEALAHLWETRPEWRGRLTFVQKGTESRSRIPAYRSLQERVEETVADINARFGTDDWQPVVYTTEMLDGAQLAGLYRGADFCLVSSHRDGMNIVAKEYVASQVDDDGVLLLSELAGAREHLGDDAVLIHPRDTPGMADAVERALTMDADERRRRMDGLRERVREYDIYGWLADQFRTAETIERGRPEADEPLDASLD